jgi:geranylgeranyl diphosphate synthase type II
MYTTEYLLNYINKAINEISYPNKPEGLYAPIKYTLDGGGKRIRPVLTLAVCDALGVDIAQAINQALGIEIYHNFTLLHDDVMDKADMRRGRPTVHIKWNEETAILSGDAMLTMASQYACINAGDKIAQVMELFNRTAMEVYEGQQYDMDFESRNDVTVEEYLNMIRLKTSVLLGCACEMGALMAGASDEVKDAFYKYGVKLGLAFQLQDDYLDTYGDPAVFGKKIGGDILNDKKTWLLISAMAEDKSGHLQKMIGADIAPEEKIATVTAIYNELNLAERCHVLIDNYAADAISELDKIQLSAEAKSFFVELAQKSCRRTH